MLQYCGVVGVAVLRCGWCCSTVVWLMLQYCGVVGVAVLWCGWCCSTAVWLVLYCGMFYSSVV